MNNFNKRYLAKIKKIHIYKIGIIRKMIFLNSKNYITDQTIFQRYLMIIRHK